MAKDKEYSYPAKPLIPQIIKLPPKKVIVVKAIGDPNKVCPKYLPGLYRTAYALKKMLKSRRIAFEIGKLRARWPDFEDVPKNKWTGYYALPIPDNLASLPKLPDAKTKGLPPDFNLAIAVWEYGLIAEILHLGPYTKEGPTFKILNEFIAKQGYKKVGPHEEVYISNPKRNSNSSKIKTILRYRLQKMRG